MPRFCLYDLKESGKVQWLSLFVFFVEFTLERIVVDDRNLQSWKLTKIYEQQQIFDHEFVCDRCSVLNYTAPETTTQSSVAHSKGAVSTPVASSQQLSNNRPTSRLLFDQLLQPTLRSNSSDNSTAACFSFFLFVEPQETTEMRLKTRKPKMKMSQQNIKHSHIELIVEK